MATIQSNKSSLIGDTFKLSISKLITTLLTLVIAMLLSRYLTKTEYGTYSSALLVINLIIPIFSLGLPSSISFFLARANSETEKQNFVSVYYTLSTILSFVAGLSLVLALSAIESYFHNPLIRSIWFFLAFFPWSKLLLSSLENVLVVYQRTKLLLFFRLTNSSSTVTIIVISQLLSIKFAAFMAIYVLSQMFFTLLSYIIVRNTSKKLSFKVDKELIIKIFKFSLPIGMAAIIGMLNRQFDKLFIGGVLDVENLAIYTNAAKELPITFVGASFTAILLPKLTKLLKQNKTHEAISLWNNCTTISYYIMSYMVFAIFAFAPDVVTFLYSDKYIDGVGIFRIYILILLLRCTYFAIILNSTGKTRLILYYSIGTIVFNILLNFILYYSIGFYGPALASLITMLISALGFLIITSVIIKEPFKNIFPWRSAFFATIVNCFFCALFMYLKSLVHFEMVVGELMESIVLSILWGLIVLVIYRRNLYDKWLILKQY